MAVLAYLVHQALEQSKETGEMPDFLGDQEYQDHVETPVVLERLDYKAVLVLKVFLSTFLIFSHLFNHAPIFY